MSDNLHPLTTGTDLVPTPFEDVVTPFTGTVGTDFLMFGVGGGANIEAQTDYLNDPQRSTGNLPGLARSNFNNKAIRQGTFVAHSLSLWVSQQIQTYVPDDGNDIAWIGEWTQAISSFILALLPPGPNMGAYLPLSGGNMFGNITFNPGVSTILANNTWYFGRDTAGIARGLMIKGGDNNIYINDGTCPYVIFNGSPIINNNIWYGARSTTGSLHGVIGLLSDNNTHINTGPAAHIFLDCGTGGSVWTNGNIVLNNSQFYYCKTADANPRGVVGISSGNELQIGAGHPWVTSVFAGGGQWIYLRANVTNTTGQLIVNQYSYLNGGGRAYIPGGNDPWQIYADQGFYSRTHFIVGNTRDWTAGCLRGGTFGIADESAAAMRFEIDLSGHGHFYNNLYAGDCGFGGVTVTAFHTTAWAQVDGGLTVYNSLNVASGNLTVNGGSWLYGGANVYNGMTVQSGNFQVNAGTILNNGLTVFNSFNMASGTLWVNGPAYLYSNLTVYGQLQVGGLGWLWDGGGNQATWNTNLYLYGSCNSSYHYSRSDSNAAVNMNAGGSIAAAGNMTASGMYANYIQSYGDMRAQGFYCNYFKSYGAVDAEHVYSYGYIHADHNIDVYSANGGTSWIRGQLNLNYVWILNNPNNCLIISGHCVPIQHGYSVLGGCESSWWGIYTFWISTMSDAQLKRDIAPIPIGCLDIVAAIEPKTYRWREEYGPRMHPHSLDDHGRYSPNGDERTHWGFIHGDVNEVMQMQDRDFGGAYEDKGFGMLRYDELTAVLWQAVRELKEKVNRLEAGAPH
jgi:hypothetical protein